jgi:hypothetical protein
MYIYSVCGFWNLGFWSFIGLLSFWRLPWNFLIGKFVWFDSVNPLSWNFIFLCLISLKCNNWKSTVCALCETFYDIVCVVDLWYEVFFFQGFVCVL